MLALNMGAINSISPITAAKPVPIPIARSCIRLQPSRQMAASITAMITWNGRAW